MCKPKSEPIRAPKGPGFLVGLAHVLGWAFKASAIVAIGLLVILFGFIRTVVAGLSTGVSGK